jgi:hypothetical protein
MFILRRVGQASWPAWVKKVKKVKKAGLTNPNNGLPAQTTMILKGAATQSAGSI